MYMNNILNFQMIKVPPLLSVTVPVIVLLACATNIEAETTDNKTNKSNYFIIYNFTVYFKYAFY